MPTFTYKSADRAGKAAQGTIDADNVAQAINKLRDKGLYTTTINKVKTKWWAGGKGLANITIGAGVKSKEVTLFTRQMSTLLDAGLPLVRSLNVLRDQCNPGGLKNVLSGLVEKVETGSTFSEALTFYPKVFPRLYVSMVKAGEASGSLEVVLERLAEFAEKAGKLIAKVKSALIYPAAVICVATIVVGFLVTFIVPQFMTIFTEMDVQMPGITLFLMSISNFARERWYFAICGIVGMVILLKVLVKIPVINYYIDMLKLHIPIIGVLLQKIVIARFARTLATLITSGVPILQALQIVRNTVANEVVSKGLGVVHDNIREGETIARPLAKVKIFPLLVVSMIEVGEETGALDQMLGKIADSYEDDVDTTVAGLTSLLEPILILGMGGVVGFIVVAMFMPLVQLMGALGGG